jgi:hypothetical protein
LLGFGFLAANVSVLWQLVAYRRRRRSALLVWEAEKPRFYGLNLGLGVMFGVLLVVDVFILRRPLTQHFGEVMMCAYYGYAFPLSTRIAKGFYVDGVWADSGFMPWTQVSAVAWKDEPAITLVVMSQMRSIAQALAPRSHRVPRDPHRGRRTGPGEPGRAGRGVSGTPDTSHASQLVDAVVFDVTPVSYARCSLYRQVLRRREEDVYSNVSSLYRRGFGVEAPVRNVPNAYLVS